MISRFTAYVVVVMLCVASPLMAATDLADAVMNRDMSALRSLLANSADPNEQQSDGTTALHWAVYWDDAEAIDMLIAAGADVMAANRNGMTPMSLAAVNGSAMAIGKLLDAGAHPNAPFMLNGETPLMMAARSGNVEAVELLIDRGALVNAREYLRSTTPLMWAAQEDHADVIRALVEAGADIDAHSSVETLALNNVIGRQAMQAPSVPGGLTALVFAAREGARAATEALVEAGADVNKPTANGSSAMLVAVQNGHYDLAAYLLENGADPDIANSTGWSPLYIAIKNRNLETGTIPLLSDDELQPLDFAELLLKSGADPNIRARGNTEVRNGQRATWLAEDGATPLLRAAFSGDLTAIRLLLAYGADPLIKAADNTTALMAAAGVGWTDGFIHEYSQEETIEVIRLLMDLGVDINAANDRGLTALHGAAHKAANPTVQFLVDNGGDLRAEDKAVRGTFEMVGGGFLPLDWAEGVIVGVQSAIYHAETVELIKSLMEQQGIPIPERNRTKGGNAAAFANQGAESQ